jgi:hypothetical protein
MGRLSRRAVAAPDRKTPMKTPLLVLLLALGCGAHAATAAHDHSLAASAASAAAVASSPTPDNARTQEFWQKHQVPGTLTLYPQHGEVGRANPIGDDFPLQLLFAGDATPLDCRIHLPQADGTVKPGETAVVTVQCSQTHRVFNHGFAYQAFENGRKIGEGTLRP